MGTHLNRTVTSSEDEQLQDSPEGDDEEIKGENIMASFDTSFDMPCHHAIHHAMIRHIISSILFHLFYSKTQA